MMSVMFILNSRIYKIMARMISQINLRQIRFFLPFLAGCHNVEFRVNVANTLLSTNSVFCYCPVGPVLRCWTEWPIILNSNAHIFWPKGAQKCAHPNFSKKRTNAHIFWPKGAQKCAHQKFWLKVHNSISRLKNVFF